MPFILIRGTYHIQGYSPDGDSIRFAAHDIANWRKLTGPAVALNGRGHAQLRLEAIDTLETHYANTHQPLALAREATEALLKDLGIKQLKFDATFTQVTSADDGVEGYILSRAAEKNHRPIAYVYAGAPPEADGSEVRLTAERLQQSANCKSLQAGLAYPTYYNGLFNDLRQACSDAVTEARRQPLGVWREDRTEAGFVVNSLEDITDRTVILPKLFRRLVQFLQGGGKVDDFREFLKTLAEPVFIISRAHFTHFDTVVEVIKQTVRMTEPPENLVFLE